MVMLISNSTETEIQNISGTRVKIDALLSTWQLVLSVLVMVFHFTSILLHSLSLYSVLILRTARLRTVNITSFTNQWLLVSLSISEMVNSVTTVIFHASFISRNENGVVARFAAVGSFVGAGMALSTVWSITINRLLSTSQPFWYRRSVTRRRFVGLFVCLCVVVAGLHVAGAQVYVVGLYRDGGDNKLVIGGSIGIILYFTYFIFCVYTYIKIIISIISSRQSLEGNNSSSNILYFIYNFINKEGYSIPLLISLTYLVFVVVPFIAGGICSFNNCADVAVEVSGVTYSLNNVSDALIYCLNNPHTCRWLRYKFAIRIQQVTPTNVNEGTLQVHRRGTGILQPIGTITNM